MKEISVTLIAVLLSTVLAACGSSGSSATSKEPAIDNVAPAEPPPPPPPTCEDYFTQAEIVANKTPWRGPEMSPELEQIAADMARHGKEASMTSCMDDAWSAEMLACGARAETRGDIASCRGMLTPEQGQRLSERVTRATKADMEAMVKAMTPPATTP